MKGSSGISFEISMMLEISGNLTPATQAILTLHDTAALPMVVRFE